MSKLILVPPLPDDLLSTLPPSIRAVVKAAHNVVRDANTPAPDHEHSFEVAQQAADDAYEALEEAVLALPSNGCHSMHPDVNAGLLGAAGALLAIWDDDSDSWSLCDMRTQDAVDDLRAAIDAATEGTPAVLTTATAGLIEAAESLIDRLRTYCEELNRFDDEITHPESVTQFVIDGARAAIAAARGEATRG